MKNKNKILYFFSFICMSICSYMIYEHKLNLHYKNNVIITSIIQADDPIEILRVNVIKGHEFELSLKDGRFIHAFLHDIETIQGSEKKVIDIFSKCRDPKVILIKKESNFWKVKIYFTIKDVNNIDIEVSLDEWLKQKGLIYN